MERHGMWLAMLPSFRSTAPPGLIQAQVIAIQPPNKLLVLVPAWGVGTRVPVTVLGAGQNDALRVQQYPLPKVGTWGVISFVHEDSRNGIWMGSFVPALASAHISSGDPDVTYIAENSGYWMYRDGQGNMSITMADGTTIEVGNPAAPTRTVVENQQAVTQEVTQAQRATLKSPMDINIAMVGGAVSIQITQNSITFTAPTFTINGNIVTTGTITNNGVHVDSTHKHGGVQTGGSDTGTPV